MNEPDIIPAPQPAKKDTILEKFGDKRTDPYYWLKERENPEVLKYLQKENDYTKKVLGETWEKKEKLFKEITGRLTPTDFSVPYPDNKYYYQILYEEKQEFPVYKRWPENSDSSKAEVLLDVNELAQEYDYYHAAGLNVSPDNKLLVFGEDTLSRRIYRLRFKDLEKGELENVIIENTTGYAVWDSSNQYIFYAVKDAALRPHKIMRYNRETGSSDLVYTEDDPSFNVYVYPSKDKKFIFIHSTSTVSDEIHFLRANEPMEKLQVIQPRERDLEYNVDHKEGSFYIRTNYNAPNFHLMKTSVQKCQKENWQPVLEYDDSRLLENFELFKDYIALIERINGITELRILPTAGEPYLVEWPEDAHDISFSTNRKMDTEEARIVYNSLVTPKTVYDYNMQTGEKTLLKRQEIRGGYDSDNYASKRIFITARDGAEVPVSLVYRKDKRSEGPSALLLYGYGSYGHSIDPYFSSVRLSLLDRGMIFAIAHIRGGEEMGRQWYEKGKLLNKKNTFYDFVDVAETLLDKGYTSKNQLFAMGGSAGGLLIGAVINMRPELWNAVVAQVPFVDVVTTMLDTTIPLTTGEYDEWGNPNDEDYYNYIRSYSPYDNVKEQAYPAILVTTGLHDSQVQYWEPAKWVARLREYTTSGEPIMLYTDITTGHSGSTGRLERYRDIALVYAFILDRAGLLFN